MGSWSSRVWGPRAGAAEGATGPRGDGAFSKRKRGEGLSESESGDESEGEERLLSTPRRQPCEVTESLWPEVSQLSFTPKPGLDLTGFSWLLAWLPFNKEAKLALLKSNFLKGPPVKKKLKSTSKYIYQTLFLNGEKSDVKICALGEEWNLHKIYLCQSGYFSSMFSGSWRESGMDTIELEIPDQNIDIEALQVAFGSLYRDEVLINPSRVIALLAAGSMLQLDGLIQQCGETMKETINAKTVCSYYNSAGTYGLDSLKKKCLEWLLNNLMTHQSVELLKELSINLMKQLISSSNLFVMQVEMDIYTALKKWMFLQLVPSWNGSLKQLLSEADAWFSKRRKDFEEGISFLETEQGHAFIPVFKYLRLQYIISDLTSARIVERDSLIPADWLFSVYKQQWFAMLRAEQDNDIGPQEINKEELEANSMRCGRKLAKDGDYCWRWTGFNFGFDLLVTYTNRYIIFKRNTLNQPCSGSVSLQPRRNIAFRLWSSPAVTGGKRVTIICSLESVKQHRLRLASFHSSGKVICSRTAGYQILTLEKDQEQVVMNLDSRLLVFPLYICCNFLYTSPEKRRENNGQ